MEKKKCKILVNRREMLEKEKYLQEKTYAFSLGKKYFFQREKNHVQVS